uniref:Seipin n=1 Tax=Entomoneis paludosa TaxID=265537 RepID=A0A7S3DUD1_9STRA|mmetsp:Transcript_37481/g.77751  ORF Transcript_37481/g.77751 Transcript_37481/m.77751 type:complete len:440 (+) Transcript_37481:73-1392(+)
MEERGLERRRLEGDPNSTTQNLLVRLIWGSFLAAPFVPRTGRPPVDNSQYYYNDIPDQKEFGGLIPFLIRTIRALLVAIFWLMVGGCTYAVFYRLMMPKNVVFKTFSFDYVPRSDNNECPVMASEEISIHTGRTFSDHRESGTCDWTPTANLDLFAKHNSWEPLHTEVIPIPNINKRLLVPNQAYFIDLALELPESESNRRSGVFQVLVELSSSTNQTALALARTSARLPHESGWVSIIRKIVFLPAFLVGAFDESRSIHLSPFRHFKESASFPLQFVSIRIKRRNAENIVEVNRGSVRIGEEMTLVQEFLKEWYFTCFCAGTFLFMWIDYILWNMACIMSEILSQKMFAMEEPPCDLDDLEEDDDYFADPTTDEAAPDFQASAFDDYETNAPQSTENVDPQNETNNANTRTVPDQNPPRYANSRARSDESSRGSWESL